MSENNLLQPLIRSVGRTDAIELALEFAGKNASAKMCFHNTRNLNKAKKEYV